MYTGMQSEWSSSNGHTHKKGVAREKLALSALSAENSRRTENHTAAHGRNELNLNPQDVPDSAVLAQVLSQKSERRR